MILFQLYGRAVYRTLFRRTIVSAIHMGCDINPILTTVDRLAYQIHFE